MLRRFSIAFLLAIFSVPALPAQAQFDIGLNLGGGDAPDPSAETKLDFNLEPKSAGAGDKVTLKIHFSFPVPFHTYSQDKGWSGHTKITLDKVDGVEPLGEGFRPDRQPITKDDPVLGPVEIFKDPVVWSREFQLGPDTSPGNVLIEGKIRYQLCNEDECLLPKTKKFSLRLAAEKGKPKAKPVFEYRYPEPGGKSKSVQWVVTLSPEDAKVGDKVTLKLAAKIDDTWHLFGLDQKRENYGLPMVITESTVIGLTAVNQTGFRQDRESEKHIFEEGGKEYQQLYHHNEVAFLKDYTVTEARFGISGKTRFQYCQENRCIPGKFSFVLGSVPRSATTTPGTATSSGLGDPLDGLQIRDPAAAGDDASLATYLLYAFFGGLILNVMPCVLPVIAIKVLSFVQQAGEDRRQILILNLTYSLGVVAVFVALASMTVFFSWGWGGLFQRYEFSVGVTAFVFVMALSLLGVFEIPIPGFVGSAAGTQQKEGPTGAFLTGIFATILATPCTGPFMGTALAWSVKQDPAVIYLVWSTMGVGMALPYILFGLFPNAVKFLPQPGNWMVTFKQVCGFILLATVVFLLYGMSDKYVIPTLVLLLGLGVGLWMIGSLYNMASPPAWRIKMRALALLVTCLIAGVAYYMTTATDLLKWKPYSEEALAEAMSGEGNIVLVDFTADW